MRFAGWFERIAARSAYATAFTDWFNDKYLTLMEPKGREAWPRVKEILSSD